MIEHGLCIYLKKRKGISICFYIHQDMQFPFTFWVLFIDLYVNLQWSLLAHVSMTQNLIMEICRICFFLNISNTIKAVRLELIQHAFCKLNMLRSFSKNPDSCLLSDFLNLKLRPHCVHSSLIVKHHTLVWQVIFWYTTKAVCS